MNINKILIVGGGTSGWMTAASIFKTLPNVEVSLVESKSIPTIGVGESTLGQFNIFLDMLGLRDEDWMAECNATYKNGIRFNNFSDLGTSYDYPFGGRDRIDIKNKWAAVRDCYNLPINESYNEWHNDNSLLMKYNRCTKNTDGLLDAFDFRYDTAYHFDAKLFAEFLKKFCTGVQHHYDNIVDVNKDEYGYITSLDGEDGNYTADLFIDCTGFQSRLLEKEMGSEFLSYKPWLDNDRALAAHIPYRNRSEELVNYTKCTAIDNGWVWNTPLWDSLGVGYVYSSDFVDDDTAEMELKKHVGVDDIDFRKINIRHGMREKAWVKNVVGIGLSYAFVEPLESLSLVSTHDNIFYLLELLERKNCDVNGFSIDGFNYLCKTNLARNRDFVSLHYKLTSRTDTPYWRHQSEKEWPQQDYGTNKGVDYYTDMHRVHSLEHRWIPQAETDGFFYILAGMGEKPYGKILLGQLKGMNYPPASSSKLETLYKDFKKEVDEMNTYVKTLPSSYEFLKKHIYT